MTGQLRCGVCDDLLVEWDDEILVIPMPNGDDRFIFPISFARAYDHEQICKRHLEAEHPLRYKLWRLTGWTWLIRGWMWRR